MKKKVIVVIKPNEEIATMGPYLEKVTRPGMVVVFLLPYPVDGFRWPEAALAARTLARHYSWEHNLKRAEEKVAPAAQACRSKGIEVAVELYCGSLPRALRQRANSEVSLGMRPAGMAAKIARLLDGTLSMVELPRRPNFSFILLSQLRGASSSTDPTTL